MKTDNADKASARSWGAAGIELFRLERHAQAAAALECALELAQAPEATGLEPMETAISRAEWATALVGCRLEQGQVEAARVWHPKAEAMLASFASSVPAAASTAARRAAAVDASLRLEAARLHFRAGRLNLARSANEEAAVLVRDLPAPLLQARIDFNLAGLLAHAGELENALALWQRAEGRLDAFGLQGLHGGPLVLRARAAMNQGSVLADLGRHDEAAAALQKALLLFEGLVHTGHPSAKAELARALRNHGAALGRAGRHTESVSENERALRASAQAMRQVRAPAERQAWQYSRGGTFNNLGHSLYAVGRFDEARTALASATRELTRLVRGSGSAVHRDELARAWINRAHLEAHLGRLGHARRLYARAAVHFGARAGEALTAAHRINAAAGLARVALRQGRISEAAEHFVPTMKELAALTRAGQLQHEAAWLALWQAQRDAFLASADKAEEPAAKRPARLSEAAAAMLIAALAEAPHHAVGQGGESVHALAAAARERVPWALLPTAPRGPATAAAERVAVAYLEYLLDWMAELLADTDPNWVKTQAVDVEAAIESLRENAHQRADAAAPLARWFFATRGLRAQRSALVAGDVPEVHHLSGLLRRLHGIEQEILGERSPPDSCSASNDSSRANADTALSQLALPVSAAARARQHAWVELNAEVRRSRTELVDRGVLPPTQRLDVRQVLERLAPRQALVLLARPQPDRLLVLSLWCEPHASQRRIAHALEPLDAELAAFPCATLHAIARAGWAAGFGGAADVPADPDGFALAMFGRLWQGGLQPTLARLRACGVTSIDLVPSGDLHLVPWNHCADTSWPGQLRLYPSAGAWWRCRSQTNEASPPAHPRWALVASTPGVHGLHLPWMEVERRLSSRLWGAAMRPIQLSSAVACDGDLGEADALLGMGHGLPADGNPAHVGLLVDGGTQGAPALLLPHHLLHVRGCRRALLSACLLGQVDGTPGEALGFAAGCFDHRFVFAAGWLTEVGDQAACLYSLAAQWALKHRAPSAGWSEALAAMRQGLMKGLWPAGLADWLGDEWRDVTGTDHPAAPPASLRRAVPWAVTLG